MNLIKIIGFYSGRYSSSATSAAGKQSSEPKGRATTDSVQPRECGTATTGTSELCSSSTELCSSSTELCSEFFSGKVSVFLCLGLNLSSMVAMTLYAADAGTVKPYFSWHSFLRYEICVDLGMLSRYFLTSGS